MERVKAVFKPSDYPGELDDATAAGLIELFGYLFPGQENPEIDAAHAGIAMTAQNPLLALNLAKMSGFIVRDLGWCQDQKLHELVVQTVHLHFNCQYTLHARAARAQSLGIGAEALAAIPDWQASPRFSATEKLVIEYTYAVITGTVPMRCSRG